MLKRRQTVTTRTRSLPLIQHPTLLDSDLRPKARLECLQHPFYCPYSGPNRQINRKLSDRSRLPTCTAGFEEFIFCWRSSLALRNSASFCLFFSNSALRSIIWHMSRPRLRRGKKKWERDGKQTARSFGREPSCLSWFINRFTISSVKRKTDSKFANYLSPITAGEYIDKIKVPMRAKMDAKDLITARRGTLCT